jgi:hypothetical protein
VREELSVAPCRLVGKGPYRSSPEQKTMSFALLDRTRFIEPGLSSQKLLPLCGEQ